jgi:hypothetical protein
MISTSTFIGPARRGLSCPKEKTEELAAILADILVTDFLRSHGGEGGVSSETASSRGAGARAYALAGADGGQGALVSVSLLFR